MPDELWLAIGLCAQLAFGARFIIQWLASERARASVLPEHFWRFSVLGSVLMLAYAAHQRDPVIIAGQALGLSIYLRNLQLMARSDGRSGSHFLPPWLLLCSLAVIGGALASPAPLAAVLDRVPSGWLLLGFVGQALFTGRFIVQWWVSERRGMPCNPLAFWYLSIIGSGLLLAYALKTGDPVVILGQSLGMAVYLRNLQLWGRPPPRNTAAASQQLLR